MTTKEKGGLIAAILSHLKFAARNADKAFDEADTFLALAFRTDDELRRIAKLAGL